MFASKGEKTPPCGVPIIVGLNTPSSITPDLRNFSTRSRMFPSATSAATAFVSVLAPQEDRLENTTSLEFPLQCGEILFEVGLEHVDAHFVYVRRATVLFCRFEG